MARGPEMCAARVGHCVAWRTGGRWLGQTMAWWGQCVCVSSVRDRSLAAVVVTEPDIAQHCAHCSPSRGHCRRAFSEHCACACVRPVRVKAWWSVVLRGRGQFRSLYTESNCMRGRSVSTTVCQRACGVICELDLRWLS